MNSILLYYITRILDNPVHPKYPSTCSGLEKFVHFTGDVRSRSYDVKEGGRKVPPLCKTSQPQQKKPSK